jgi:hypothetical protein
VPRLRRMAAPDQGHSRAPVPGHCTPPAAAPASASLIHSPH